MHKFLTWKDRLQIAIDAAQGQQVIDHRCPLLALIFLLFCFLLFMDFVDK